VDLPTYTSIWRIEKRLYKLYDFRLPMPLPIGQVTVFAAMAVPYVVLLTLLGVPFNHTLIWLYILPPGLATWLVTRPVLESKRLPELIKSQLRYLAEPRIFCRMAPLAERDVMIVSGRVWRPRAGRRSAETYNRRAAMPVQPAEMRLVASGPPAEARQARPVPESAEPSPPGPAGDGPVPAPPARAEEVPVPAQAGDIPAPARAAGPAAASPSPDASRQPPRPLPPRPVITVVGGAARDTPPAVERALAGPSARRGDTRAGRVTVVPGGHRPGKPELLQRDRARAQLPINGSAKIVVIGCTVGAGQTMTTLLLGDVLASLRSDRVAVIDLNPGASSLARRARARPALSQAALTGRSRLAVIGPQRAPGAEDGRGMRPSGGPPDPDADAATLEAAAGQHDLVLADPATAAVPRLLAIADQLVLVAPASGAAPGAIAMTFEWLDAHRQADLADGSIMVLNGVSRRSISQVEQAERVCAGRCRAIVRVPWDDQLQNQIAKRIQPAAPGSQAHQHWAGILSPGTASAYTALAGLLVASLAGQDPGTGEEHKPAHAGRAER
jgi:MinD-like ATPase involved in chromosome partitioning or flagellar assembly